MLQWYLKLYSYQSTVIYTAYKWTNERVHLNLVEFICKCDCIKFYSSRNISILCSDIYIL